MPVKSEEAIEPQVQNVYDTLFRHGCPQLLFYDDDPCHLTKLLLEPSAHRSDILGWVLETLGLESVRSTIGLGDLRFEDFMSGKCDSSSRSSQLAAWLLLARLLNAKETANRSSTHIDENDSYDSAQAYIDCLGEFGFSRPQRHDVKTSSGSGLLPRDLEKEVISSDVAVGSHHELIAIAAEVNDKLEKLKLDAKSIDSLRDMPTNPEKFTEFVRETSTNLDHFLDCYNKDLDAWVRRSKVVATNTDAEEAVGEMYHSLMAYDDLLLQSRQLRLAMSGLRSHSESE